jgi:hypothetical protein
VSDSSQGPGWWLASDGKWYPPQPPAPPPDLPPPTLPPPTLPPPSYGPAPPPTGAYAGPIGPPPSSGTNGCLKWGLIVGGIIAVLGIGSCVFVASRVDDVVDDIDFDDSEEFDDVDLEGCGRDSSGFLRADLEVTNDSSERSNYLVTVTFEDGDGDQIDTGVANVVALEPRQSTAVTAQSFAEFTGDFDCRVVGVERFSDEG